MFTSIPRAITLRAAFAAAWLAIASLVVAPVLAAGDTAERTASTASYNLTLDVGPMEMMLTPDQAKAQKATSGEIMASVPGMGMPMAMAQGNRHVELHVYQKAGGAVVKDATVTITLTNAATNASIAVQPIMAMYGVAQGEADWHYGNNAQVGDGTYRATATVNGQTATFAPFALGPAPAAAGMAGSQMHGSTMPAAAPATGRGASFDDLPEPVEVFIVVALSVVAGVMLQRIKRAAVGESRDSGFRR